MSYVRPAWGSYVLLMHNKANAICDKLYTEGSYMFRAGLTEMLEMLTPGSYWISIVTVIVEAVLSDISPVPRHGRFQS